MSAVVSNRLMQNIFPKIVKYGLPGTDLDREDKLLGVLVLLVITKVSKEFDDSLIESTKQKVQELIDDDEATYNTNKGRLIQILDQDIMTERNLPIIEWYLGYQVDKTNQVRLLTVKQ